MGCTRKPRVINWHWFGFIFTGVLVFVVVRFCFGLQWSKVIWRPLEAQLYLIWFIQRWTSVRFAGWIMESFSLCYRFCQGRTSNFRFRFVDGWWLKWRTASHFALVVCWPLPVFGLLPLLIYHYHGMYTYGMYTYGMYTYGMDTYGMYFGRMMNFREWWIFGNDKFSGMTNFREWQIFENDEFSGMTNFQGWRIFENDEFSGMTNFWEWRIFGNDEFSGMTNFQEWQIFKNDEFSGKTNFRLWWIFGRNFFDL